MGILHLTRAQYAPCTILASFSYRKSGKPQHSATLFHGEHP
jgi:hypothetical protein